jgi:hypothetical protein
LLLLLALAAGGASEAGAVHKGNASTAREAALMASFIPRSAGPWQAEADEVYDPETIFSYIDGAGEVYRSYNFRLLVARRFHKDGKPDIVVDLFDMGGPSDAFGVFTHDLDGQEAGVGQGSRYRAGLLSFWKDRYFGSVYAEEETAETRELVLELGRSIAAAIPGKGRLPEVLAFLPRAGLRPDSERFFHNYSVLNYHFFVADQDILRLEGRADALLATYDLPSGQARLLVVRYQTPETAAEGLAAFVSAYMPDAGKKGIIRTEDGKWTSCRRMGRTVTVVFGAASERDAAGLFEEVEKLVREREK